MKSLALVAVFCCLLVVAIAAPYPYYYAGYHGYDENRDRLDDR